MASHVQVQKLTPFEISFFVLIALYALWSFVRIVSSVIPDFSVLYQSAQNLLAGRSLYHDYRLFTGLGYPAVSLLPYLPFTFLSQAWAATVWIFLSYVSYLASVYLSLRLIEKESVRSWAWICALGFLAFPTKFTFGMGQVNFIALALLLLGTSSLRVAPFLRVALLATSLLFKPHFIFVYVGLIFTNKRKYIIASLICVALLWVCLGFITHWVPDREYLRDMVPSLLVFKGREIYYNQGIGGFVSRLLGASGVYLSHVSIAAIVFVSIYALAKKRLNVGNVLAVLLPMQVLIEPLAWQHHLVFLLPTFVLLWFMRNSREVLPKVILILCYLLVGWNIKNPLYWQGSILGTLVLSHGFAGACILWYMAIRYL